MDPNTSIGRLCLGENNQGFLAEGIENKEQWEGPEFQDIASSGQEKEAKYEKNLISNEFAVKLCLEYEEKNGEKLVKRELLVSLNGEFYFVKFIVNPEEDNVEPSVIFGRSFMRLAKGIANFGNGVITIHPELDPFLDNSEETKKFEEDWDQLLDIDFGDIPEIIEAGPSLSNGKPLTQEKAAREALAIDICKKIPYLRRKDPSLRLWNIVIREALQEKEDPGAFIILIQLKAKIDLNALTDTSLDINAMPYRIYTKLGREEVKKVNRGIIMLNHSKTEPIGVLKDVLCQVGVTTIIAKFFILDMPFDRDAPILVGRGFLYTSGSVLNTIDRITSTFDGVCHQTFRAAKTSLNTKESDSDDKEDYGIQRNSFGAPMYGPKPAKYLNCFLGSLSVPLQHMEWKPDYKGNFYKKEEGDGQWHAEIRLTDPYGNMYDQGFKTNPTKRKLSKYQKLSDSIGTHDDEAGSSSSRPKELELLKMYNINLAGNLSKQIYSPFIVDWNILNTLRCGNAIEDVLEVRVNEMGSNEVLFRSVAGKRTFDINESIYTELCHEIYATFEFDKAVANDELMTKKAIKFRLCSKAYAMSILDFAKRLGLRNDDDFSADQYWLNISSEEISTLSRSSAKTIRKPVLKANHQNGYANVTWIAKRLGILSDEVLNGLSAPTYCRTLDAKILRELIGSNGRLIPEEIAHSIPRVATPRAPRPTTSDLYEKISQLETRIGGIERMTRRQSYHSDRYARVLKHISSHFEVAQRDPYDPPSYFEQQQQDDEE
ncbi:retrotransposon ORF1 [Tanacetum coccineum]